MMRIVGAAAVAAWFAHAAAAAFVEETAATNVLVRLVAANLNGNTQSYQPFALRIFRGIRPDIVAINEFNYGDNSAADLRSMVTSTFGPQFTHYRESGAGIPNGVISRWPIIASGEWDDPTLTDRDFAWARIDIPGPADLYVVSVHLKAGSGSANSGQRAQQADQIRRRVQADFPAGAHVVVAGDFNFQSRTGEEALDIFGSFLRDQPVPADQQGDPDTNNPRSRPYDLVLQSPSLTALFVPVRLGQQSFANGLVFDSRVFNPLADVAPVLREDSGLAQHMAVVKDYRIPYLVTNRVAVAAPRLELSGEELRWNSPTNLAWRVEATDNLDTWTPLATNAAPATNRVQRIGGEDLLRRFLRVVLQR